MADKKKPFLTDVKTLRDRARKHLGRRRGDGHL